MVEEIFAKLSAAGMSIAASKCIFGVESLEYLGYVVSAEGISPVKKKIAALQNFPAPTKQKELLAFLGSLNYYRSSLPNLDDSDGVQVGDKGFKTPAAVLDPLYKLATCGLKKKEDFEKIWKESEIVQAAFKEAKLLLTKAVTLNHPIPSAPLALSTDASKVCLGASLDPSVFLPVGKIFKTQHSSIVNPRG